MQPWVANALGLTLLAFAVAAWAAGLLWRVGSWHVSDAARLTHDEGLRVGSASPQLACLSAGNEFHLDFEGRTALVVFGVQGCAPCHELMAAAAVHPATLHMRRVYVADAEPDVDPDVLAAWETYTFVDEKSAREMWQAPVSPYFHVIDPDGRVVEKGIANLPAHLDRLVSLPPPPKRRWGLVERTAPNGSIQS